MEPFFVPAVLLTKGTCNRQKKAEASYFKQILFTEIGSDFMDAKWNNIVDNAAVRMGAVIVVFGAWLAISYSLLK
jgi:hypothetical protein